MPIPAPYLVGLQMYEIDDEAQAVTIQEIGNRRSIYK